MKIAIPSMDESGLNAAISQHFGQTPFFTIVDTDSDQVTAIANPGHQGDRTPVDAIADEEAHVVLCSGMGGRAVQFFATAGIEVFMGAEGTVQETLDAYREGTLPVASEDAACKEHH